MAFKFAAFLTLVAVAAAGVIPVEHHQVPAEHQHALYHNIPVAHAHAPEHVHLHKQHPAHEEYPDDPHPQYKFAYDVKDTISGDSKSQSESRDGDVVHGEYSLDDADGFRRTVKYTADPVHGFNAVVQREPLTHKVVAEAAPVQYHHVPAPRYTSLPSHQEHHNHDHHASYASYAAPHHEVHEYYHH